jgi:hypothetical protein
MISLPSSKKSSGSSGFVPRIWTPGKQLQRGNEIDGAGGLTVREAYQQFVKPGLISEKASAGTLEAYENALDHWERVMLRDPVLEDLDDGVMDEFRDAAEADPEFEATTCNKWFRHIRAILNRMGPRMLDKRTRRNKRFFAEVPYLEDLPEDEPDPVELTELQINAMYEAAGVAKWPLKERTGVDAAHWWRTSLVFLVNYGTRRHDWLWLARSGFNGKGEFGFRAKKTNKQHDFVLNDAFASHLELFPTDREYVFTPTKTHKQLYREFGLIQKAAGVSRPDGHLFGFQDLRQTCAARYHDFAPGTAEIVLGHALPDPKAAVTKKYYLGKQWLKPMWRAVKTIPQPAAFRPTIEAYLARRKREDDPNQLKLFDLE